MSEALTIAAVSFVLNIVVLAIIGIWKLSRVEVALNSAINLARADIEDKQAQSIREFGETAAALRQKIHDVEVWTSNTLHGFLRTEAFNRIHDGLSTNLQQFSDRIDTRLGRLEEKIDDIAKERP